jgi:hypothetical protein
MSEEIKYPSINVITDLQLSVSNAHIKANRFIEKIRQLKPYIERLSLQESPDTKSLQVRFREAAYQYPELISIVYDDGFQMNVTLFSVTPEEYKHQRFILGFFEVTNNAVKPLGHSIEITAHVLARMLQRYSENSALTMQNLSGLLQTIYIQSLQNVEPEKLKMGEKLPCIDKNGVQHTFVISGNVIHPGEIKPTARFSILTYYI